MATGLSWLCNRIGELRDEENNLLKTIDNYKFWDYDTSDLMTELYKVKEERRCLSMVYTDLLDKTWKLLEIEEEKNKNI